MLTCRLCLQKVSNSIDIFDKALQVSEIIKRHFWFEVKKDDPISTYLCNYCWIQVFEFDKFYCEIKTAQDNYDATYKGVFTSIPIENIKIETDETNNNFAMEQKFLQRLAKEKERADFGEINCFVKGEEGHWEQVPISKIKQEVQEEQAEIDIENIVAEEINDKDSDEEQQPATSVAMSPVKKQLTLDSTAFMDDICFVKEEEHCAKDQIKSSTGSVQPRTVPEPIVENVKQEVAEPVKTENYSMRLSKIKALNCIANHAAVVTDDEDEQMPNTSEVAKQKQQRDVESDFKIEDSSSDSWGSRSTIKNEEVAEDKYSKIIEHYSIKTANDNGERPFVCQVCSRSFNHARNLERHIGTHTKNFACNICTKRYARADILNRHMKTHQKTAKVDKAAKSSEKPGLTYNHKCEHCDKAYVNRPALLDHIYLKHMPEDMKKFQCNKCPKKFYNASLLYRHKIYHSAPEAPKKFQCEHCSKSFSEAYSLRKHVNGYHSGQIFACTECPKKFIYAYLLRRHMGAHERFACNKCTKTFTRALTLRKHIEEIH